ncbi:MAG: extracellular solute-binding protein [Anaerolineales bacterium]|nr:extracellular solute-binding protein [Anaerolineales bacterium]
MTRGTDSPPAAATGAATAAAASAPDEPAEPTGTAEPPVPTVEPTGTSPVTFTWWHINSSNEGRDYWQTLADEYMAVHPNVTIHVTVLENEPFTTKLTTVMQSGDPPDLFQSWGGRTLNEYAEAGLLKDITAYLDSDGGAWRGTFSPGALGVYSYGGRNYGVPWDMGLVGFWYNKQLFASAGIPNPPATWSDFFIDIMKLQAAGIIPVALGEGDRWPGMFWYAYLATRIGGQAAFESAYDRTGSFADPAFVEAGRELQKLVANSAFQEDFLTASYIDEATAMGYGDAAMELMGQWAPMVDRDNSGDPQDFLENLGWFPFPAVEGGAGDPDDVFGGGNGFAVGKNAPAEAVDFAKYLTRVEAQIRCAEENLCIPVVKGGEAGLTDPLLLAVQRQLAKAKYLQLYYDQYLGPYLGQVVYDSVWDLLAGRVTPEQAAQTIEDCAQQELG